VTIGVYFDDLIITSPRTQLVGASIKAIKDKYIQHKIHEGHRHNYLGMVLDFAEARYVHINQTGMIEEINQTTTPALRPSSKQLATRYLFYHTCLVYIPFPRFSEVEYHTEVIVRVALEYLQLDIFVLDCLDVCPCMLCTWAGS
jgi:hypothetical protein